MRPSTVLHGADAVTEDGLKTNLCLAITGNTISYIGDEQHLRRQIDVRGAEHIDAHGGLLVPAFVDVHVHGGRGSDFMEGEEEAVRNIARFHAERGTAALLATTVTASRERLARALDAIGRIWRNGRRDNEARIAGVHLEGPFISRARAGAQHPEFIVAPQVDWLAQWHRQYSGLLKIVTLAPETEGAFSCIEWLNEQGIIPAAGHTDADFSVVTQAACLGLRHAVHTYNAMRELHHREPGALGAVLTDDRISAEIIADGHHVHPAAIRLLLRAKPKDKLLLVSDAMAAAGLPDGAYELGGLPVDVTGLVAKLRGTDRLAGSTITMLDAFRYMVREIGVEPAQASRMASLNPARLLGLDGQTGSLRAGKQADVLLLDRELQLQHVWVEGTQIR